MTSLPSLLSFAHLIGLALAVGSATAKLTLLLRSKADNAFLPTYIAVSRPVTRLIILGLVLLTASGIGWLPVIDNVVEPKFRQLAPGPGESPSPAFTQIQRRYLFLELVATGLFYVIVVMWVLV
jgi:hypothetical protein